MEGASVESERNFRFVNMHWNRQMPEYSFSLGIEGTFYQQIIQANKIKGCFSLDFLLKWTIQISFARIALSFWHNCSLRYGWRSYKYQSFCSMHEYKRHDSLAACHWKRAESFPINSKNAIAYRHNRYYCRKLLPKMALKLLKHFQLRMRVNSLCRRRYWH